GERRQRRGQIIEIAQHRHGTGLLQFLRSGFAANKSTDRVAGGDHPFDQIAAEITVGTVNKNTHGNSRVLIDLFQRPGVVSNARVPSGIWWNASFSRVNSAISGLPYTVWSSSEPTLIST